MFYIFIPTKMFWIKINDWKIKYWLVDITEEPVLNRVSADGWVFLRPSMMEKRKDFVVLVDRENALWEIYVNEELVWIERCWTKEEAENVLYEYVQRQYDMEEACWDYDLDFNE